MIFLGAKRSMLPLMIAVFTEVFSSCNSPEQKQQQPVAPTPVKPALMQPFRYHKLIEVSPGNSFDIFSWGRGSTQTGSFLILASDSAETNYVTTTGDLDGSITDVYNTDMDMDGNPEILIQAKSNDSTAHNQIYAFEYNNHKARKLEFPKLNQSQKKGYRGEDNFYINEGTLMREFPVFDDENPGVKTSSSKRVLEYSIRNNNFTVKTIDQEDESKKQNTAVTDTTKKTPVKEASTNTQKSSSKNTSQKKHRRVKERRRHQTSKTDHKRSSHSGKKNRKHRR